MELGISGARAVVCGASKGLGYACARALVNEGCDVVLVARGHSALEDAVAALRSNGRPVSTVCADVSSEEGRTAIVARAGKVDILVNNAGGPPPGDFRTWTRKDWIAAFDVSALSAILLTTAVAEGMLGRGFGRIVNITSIAVKQPQPLLGLSTSARLALTGFVASIARELAGRNVTINNILPGYFQTERFGQAMQAWATASGDSLSSVQDARSASIPAQRFGDPEELGRLCAFLCSRHSSYLTGQNILLDGGLYAATL